MGIYHPCKIIDVVKKDKEVAASDESVQLVVEAWDELQWAVSLDPKLVAEKLLANDVVIVDWSVDTETKVPRMNAIKILKGKKAENIWKLYKDYLKKQKAKIGNMESKQQSMAASYMG